MKLEKIKIYLTHDTDDLELLYLLVDALHYIQIFNVIISPFDLPGTIPEFDDLKKYQIDECDLIIALFTRLSLRSELVRKEISYANSQKMITIPIRDAYAKLRGIGMITGNWRLTSFVRNDLKKIIRNIISITSLNKNIPKLSEESINKAKKALNVYSKDKFHNKISKASGKSSFKKIVVEILKNLDYKVRLYSSYVPRTRFDMIAKKEGYTINIICVFRTVNNSDVARYAQTKIKKGKIWIISLGFSSETQKMAEALGIVLIDINKLLNELPSSTRVYLNKNYVQILFAKSVYKENVSVYPQILTSIESVKRAKTSVEKGRSLEKLAGFFVNIFPKLEVIGRNIRIESQEIDLIVKNENEKIFWQRLGSPIMIECKNWNKPVGASEIRDLVGKMRELKTAFLITALGITTRNGASREIIEARKKMKFIIVLDINDIEEIVRGTNPEYIVEERFYSLWTQS